MNVISTCLFGDIERYHRYLPTIIRAYLNIYSGWFFRIYHDEKIDSGSYSKLLRELEKQNIVELKFVSTTPPRGKGGLWRLLPIWDPSVDRFLMRDIDAIPGFRERCAVEIWIRSDLSVHSISDLAGGHDYPVLTGMMGFKSPETRKLLGAASLDDLFARAGWSKEKWEWLPWSNQNLALSFMFPGMKKGDPHRVSPSTTNEQFFLGNYIWPLVYQQACEHRLSGSMTFQGSPQSHNTVAEIKEDLGITPAVRTGSDAFVRFMGSPDVDIIKALEFYKINGNPVLEKIISDCEARST